MRLEASNGGKMLERNEFRKFLISMLSAAVVGDHMVDSSDAKAADSADSDVVAGDLNCPGFDQVVPFNEVDETALDSRNSNPARLASTSS
jgi:hypothetical protein